MTRRLLGIALALTVVAALPLTLPATAATKPGHPVPPGCAPDRPAVAHLSGGHVLNPQPPTPPIPCGIATGYAGGENRVGVTNTGAVVYAPAVVTPGLLGTGFAPGAPGKHPQTVLSPAGLAVSTDHGSRWGFVAPMGMTWLGQDHQLFVDPATGRIFWSNFTPNPIPGGGIPLPQQPPAQNAHLLMSADDGRTWYHTQAPCCPAFSENPRFASGPAPAGGASPAGYPNVLYYCANTQVGFTSPVVLARVCSRSLDGGLTWKLASVLFTSSIPQHAECGTSGEKFGALDGNYPQAASDGSLFVTVVCGGKTFLARSTDEGATWPILRNGSGAPLQVPAAEELRLDQAGNLYLFGLEGGRLVVRISRDGGQTWAAPLDLTAPGVTHVGTWYPAVRRPGHLVVAYYGQRAGQVSFDGYLTVSRSALAPTPVFWSATVNDPSSPMFIDAQGTRPPGPGYDEFNGADIGPDATGYGSFIQDCPPGATDPVCVDPNGKPKRYAARGFVGRLVFTH